MLLEANRIRMILEMIQLCFYRNLLFRLVVHLGVSCLWHQLMPISPVVHHFGENIAHHIDNNLYILFLFLLKDMIMGGEMLLNIYILYYKI